MPPARERDTGASDGRPAPPPVADQPTPAPPREPQVATVRSDDADWAATSSVLAAAGQRLATVRRTWTWWRTGRLLTSTVAIMVLLVTGLGWGATSWLEAAVRQIGALDPDSSAIRDAAAQQGDQNFLVVGSDTRIGDDPVEDAGDAADVPGARADTVMIIHIPEERTGATVVAFPRDLEITRPECERWNSATGQYTGEVLPRTPQVKLNSAYAAGGPRCVTRSIQEISGIAINRFLGVDFQGFQGMVDSVGGVPICVERPIRDSVLGEIVPEPGTTMLSGQQALDFVRARNVEGDFTSDYARIQRQQQFLSSLLRTSLSSGTLLDPLKLQGLVDSVARSTFGENIGSSALLTLAQSLGDLDPRTVTFTTVPTTGEANSRGNEDMVPEAARELFTAIIQGGPLPGAEPASEGAPGAPAGPAPGAPVAPPPPPPMSPEQVRAVLVDGRSSSSENSSESSSDSSSDSVASVEQELRGEGFSVVADDRSASADTTTVRFSPDQAAAATLLAQAVPDAVLDPSAPGLDVLTLTLGDDFENGVTALGSAAAGPAAPPVVPTTTGDAVTCA